MTKTLWLLLSMSTSVELKSRTLVQFTSRLHQQIRTHVTDNDFKKLQKNLLFTNFSTVVIEIEVLVNLRYEN